MSPIARTLTRPALVLVTDAQRLIGHRDLAELVSAAVDGGVTIVQLREKDLPPAERCALATRVRDAIAGRALFFVNGDIEVARAINADGIHLPSSGTTIRDARSRLGDNTLISLAVHSVDGARRAQEDGADIVQIGTVFPSPTHPGASTLGLGALRETCAAVAVPVVAIGGITAANAPGVMAAGAAGVAVISAILDAPDARDAAATLSAALGAHLPAHPSRGG
jgi:thiamine-phosphate pyrophosphorylase